MKKPPARSLLLCCIGFVACAAAALPRQDAQELTLEQIMADPDWIGNEPQRPYWADDGQTVYFLRKRTGEDVRDLVQIDLQGNELRVVKDEERASVDVPGGDLSTDGKWKVYEREGDLYLEDLETHEIRQLTRTTARESRPSFLVGDKSIQFQRNGDLLVRELETGLEYEPAELLAQDDPAEKKEKEPGFLAKREEELFAIVKKEKEQKDAARERSVDARRADRARVALPYYLGKDVEIRRTSLSPSGEHMLVVLAPKKDDRGKRDSMPNYVTSSGYVESRSVRDKVGTGKPGAESLVLIDLDAHEQHELSLDVLPGIDDEPRTWPKDEKADDEEAGETKDDAKPEKEKKKEARPTSVRTIDWNDRGDRALVQLRSFDDEDLWTALVDLEAKVLVPQERQHDDAWVGRFDDVGWLPDGRRFYLQSEETGYGHLYLRDVETGQRRALTSGDYEVSEVHLNRAGTHLYYTANAEHPGVHDTWRVDVETGEREQLTDLGGRTSYELSPDERRLLLDVSYAAAPSELYVQDAAPGAQARRLTLSTSEAFRAIDWVEPEFVAVPSDHGRPIYSRVYVPDGPVPPGGHPAVMFVHGAGYLQNAHKGWSHYFREFMFHTLLVRRGYVVLDMDYRASAGYGRDWRTAIYRDMGAPECADLRDGVEWLVANRGVDRARVGVYGGSYGGFLTLMALFREPDLFACGAALRPVTDWAHYNDPYTSNILNTPDIDPEAYERSSPITYADGLQVPLLMCHGMQDDNVFFQDTVRLAQRLIELEKEDWEVAIYPIEPHGFREPSSWLDEYRRILKLFETHLAAPRALREEG